MDLGEVIKRIAEEKLAPGQYIVDVVISAKKGPKKVMVVVDGDNGFNIDECAVLSRHLSDQLDEQNLISDNYMLEVSTPGVDHPLKLNRQYKKNIGRKLKVKMAGQTIEGKLSAATEESITLIQETGSGKNKEFKAVDIPLSGVEKAVVMVSFK